MGTVNGAYFLGLLLGSSVAAGALNAVAGGGSFLTFPSLVLAGLPPVSANATSTVALWPGSGASVGAYGRELGHHGRSRLAVLTGASVVGGLLGALLLLWTPSEVFVRLAPYLLLGATLLYGGAPLWARRRATAIRARAERSLAALAAVQLPIALYGGYFGGGIGILTLAALDMLGLADAREANALKVLLVACVNGTAVVAFALSGAVAWPQAVLMALGSAAGGYWGAGWARRLDPRWLRALVVAVGLTTAAYLFAAARP